MHQLFLNGRFLTRTPTGVDRVASELSLALLKHPGFGHDFSMQLLAPNTADTPLTAAQALDRDIPKSIDPLSGQLWEQTRLATLAPQKTVLSLCNTGPIWRRNQAVLIHDAQVFENPESYAPHFRKLYQVTLPRLGRSAALVMTVSNHAKSQLEQHGVVPVGKAKVLYNGADHMLRVRSDPSILTRHNLAPQSYFLAIGSSAAHKNLDVLQRAAPMRQDQTCPIVIAGGQSAAIFGATRAHGTSNLMPLGRVSDAALKALYENARALLFPSLNEGFGLPPLEAMICGCPVAATTAGAVPEVCGDAPLYCDPQDALKWANAMDRFASEPALRDRLTMAGRVRASQFTWSRSAATLVKYLEALHGHRMGLKPVGAA